MAAPVFTPLETPSLPRHLIGAEFGVEIFNVTTDGSPSNTTFTPKIIQNVFAVIGMDGYTITAPRTINVTGALLPVSSSFTILVLGKGGA